MNWQARLARRLIALRRRIPMAAVSGTVAVISSVCAILGYVGVDILPARISGGWDILGLILFITLSQFLLVARHLYRKKTAEAEELTRVLKGFAADIRSRQHSDSFDIIEWHEIVEISKSGDGKIRAWLTIRCGDEPLRHFCDQRRYDVLPANVRVRVYQVGPGGGRGVRCPTSRSWESDGLMTYVIFERPIPALTKAQIVLEFDWPGLGHAILSTSGEMRFSFTRKVEKFHHEIIFSEDLKMSDRLSIIPYKMLTGSPGGAEHRDRRRTAGSRLFTGRRMPTDALSSQQEILPSISRFPSGVITVQVDATEPEPGMEFGYRIGMTPY